MLNVMRDNLRHLKWVLVVVALSMLLYLGTFLDRGSSRAGNQADWAARVDGHTISSQEFMQVARNQDDYYRRLLGQQYDSMRKNLRLGSQAIQTLVDRQLVLAEARALGLSATKEAIGKAILESPTFKDPSGNFIGKDRYAEVVGLNVPGGVAAYERGIGEDILDRQWQDVMTASARISDAELEQAWRTRNVRAAADYVFIPSSESPAGATVDPAAVSSWYASHASDYKRPEGRKVRMAVVDRQAQVAKVKVTDAEAKADYDAHASEYSRPEQRRVRHILFKLPEGGAGKDNSSIRELAASVLARAQKGEDFATLARTLSQDETTASQGGELGWFGRGTMVKPFEDAAFATQPGQLTPVVETEFGFHVMQVEEARSAGTTPFEEVKDATMRRLTMQRAQDLASSEAGKLAAGVKTAADLDAAADKLGLAIEEHVVYPGDRGAELGASPEFTSAVSALRPGQVSQPLAVARGLAIAACTEIVPAGTRPLAEVEQQVRQDVLSDRARQSALSTARRVVAAKSLADGAKSAKLEVKKSGDLSAGSDLPGVGPVPELDAALFRPGAATGDKGVVAAPGGAIAYEITHAAAFEQAKFDAEKAALRSQLLQQRRNQLREGLIESLRQKHTIEINQPLVDSVNGQNG
jgi:peptidyl-prolyl cis-trans isomerase D